ncbi:MAG: GTP-dependent dephospho-CoA kinase family protein [Candidatus Bathyarchaeota archaeon]
MWLLPEDLRVELKKPLGELLRGSEDEVNVKLREWFRVHKPKTVIAVGDKVSSTLAVLNIAAKLYIYDEKTKRAEIKKPKIKADRFITVKNPPGVLTENSLNTIREMLNLEGSTALKVDGEEDLLTLPAIFYAEENSVVIYGQPDEGVVVVSVNKERKDFVKNVFRRMGVNFE